MPQPNGAGKTTLLRVITTALKPTAGGGTVAGFDIRSKPDMARRHVGLITGDFPLYNRLTGREYLRYFGMLNKVSGKRLHERIEELSVRFQMDSFLDRRCGGYSAGMRQKVSISRAILGRPSVLLLDEATSNLDITASRELIDLVEGCAQDGMAILYTSHRVAEIEKLCSKLLVVMSGKPRFWGEIGEFNNKGRVSAEEKYVQMFEKYELSDPL